MCLLDMIIWSAASPPLCLARPVAENGVDGLEKCDELYKNLDAAGDVV